MSRRVFDLIVTSLTLEKRDNILAILWQSVTSREKQKIDGSAFAKRLN